MTITKIDADSLAKLRILAKRGNRSAPLQLKVLIDTAWRTNPAELTDSEFSDNMFDELVANSEAGLATEEALASAAHARELGTISWGSEEGKCIGTLVDGTRIDVDGECLKTPFTDTGELK